MHAATGCPPRIGYELLRNQWWSPTFGKVNVRNTCPTFYWSSRYSQGSTTPPTMHVTQLPIQHAMIDTTKEIKFKKKKTSHVLCINYQNIWYNFTPMLLFKIKSLSKYNLFLSFISKLKEKSFNQCYYIYSTFFLLHVNFHKSYLNYIFF